MTKVTYKIEPVGKAKILSGLSTHGAELVSVPQGVFLAFSKGVGEPDGTNPYNVEAEILNPRLTSLKGPFQLSAAGLVAENAHSAALRNGSLVSVHAAVPPGENDSAIYFNLTTSGGLSLQGPTHVPNSMGNSSAADVAALADGGFVITWTRNLTSHNEVYFESFNADGTFRPGSTTVLAGTVSPASAYFSTAAGLTNGGFVIAYTKETTAVDSSNVYFRLVDANSEPVGSTVTVGESGSASNGPELLGLKDGGFALAYNSNVAQGSLIGATLQIFNADGSPRTARLLVSSADLAAHASGTQGQSAHLMQLKNGDIVVGWSSESHGDTHVNARVFSPDGHALTGITFVADSPLFDHMASLAALHSGRFVASWQQENPDENEENYSVAGRVMELVRTSEGTKYAETIKGDDLTDRISGKGGDDDLYGRRGADNLKGGRGVDRLHGGSDDDKDVFVFTSKHDSGNGKKSTLDRIYDFDAHSKHEKVSDKIDLSGIDGDKHAKHDQKFRFVDHFENAGKGQPDGEVTVRDAGKNVKVLVDFDGDKGADMVIVVTHVHDLHKADFIL